MSRADQEPVVVLSDDDQVVVSDSREEEVVSALIENPGNQVTNTSISEIRETSGTSFVSADRAVNVAGTAELECVAQSSSSGNVSTQPSYLGPIFRGTRRHRRRTSPILNNVVLRTDATNRTRIVDSSWLEITRLLAQLANRVSAVEENMSIYYLTMWGLPMVDPGTEVANVMDNILRIGSRDTATVMDYLPEPRKGVLIRFTSRLVRDFVLRSGDTLTSHGISVGRI